MTVSSEPDGSILSLARQDLSSGSVAMVFFFGFFLHCHFEIGCHRLAQCLVCYQ